METVFDLLFLGILWLICCIPIITISASCSAFYHTMVKSVKKGEGYLIRVFFDSFQKNFFPATLLGAIVFFSSVWMKWNIGILMSETEGNIGLFFVCFYYFMLLLLLAFFCYSMAVLSRFQMKLAWIIKVSCYMIVRYLPITAAIYVVLACFGILIYRVPFLIFVLPGICMFVLSDFMEKVLERHMPISKY